MIQAVPLMLTLFSIISASTYAQVDATPDAGGTADPVEESA